LKLHPKILKIILSLGLGVILTFPSVAQVEGSQADSTLLNFIESSKPDTVSQAREQEYLEAPVHYPARDSIIYSYSDNKIKMYGTARVTFEDIELTAEYIEMSMDKKEVYASGVKDSTGQLIGKPIFKDGEEQFEVTILRYNFDTGKAWVTDAETKIEGQEEATLHSHITKRDTAGNLHIKDGQFTTCGNTADPHWYFAITKGIMTSKKSVVSGPAYLVIEDIPLYFLGLPFGFFPKQEKKASGIIMPKFGEEANRGFYLRDFGYYFSGSEKMDLTLKGDVYSKGSWKASADSRYKKRYKFSGALGLTYATNIFGEKGIDDRPPTRDFNIRWSHNQDTKAHPYRNFSANVNFSNSAYDRNNTYYNTQQANERLRSTKSSSISFSRKFPNKLFNFTAKLGATQNSQTDRVSLNLPSGSFSVGRFYPFKRKNRVGKQKWYEIIDMRYNANFENRVNTTGLDFAQMSLRDSMQNGFEHEMPIQASFKLIPNMTLTPSMKYEGQLYFYYIQKDWDPDEEEIITSRINQLKYVQSLAPNINFSYSPQVYGFFNFKKGNLKVIRHVMKPSLSANYRPDIGYDDSRFYDSVQRNISGAEMRYSIFEDGLYRLPSVAGRAANISFRLGNNLEMKVVDKADSTGQLKKVKLVDDISMSTSYDIFRDSLNLSPFNLSARTRILNQFDIRLSGTLDPYSISQDSTGRYFTVNNYEIAKTGKPGRLTNASISMGFSLPLRKTQSRDQGRNTAVDAPGQPPQEDAPLYESDYLDYWEYDMPWRLSVNYSFRYSKPYVDPKITQSLTFNGNLSLTPNWKVDFSSGYDFVQNEITYTRIGITRNLHCWVMKLDLIPFGQYKSYTFQINVLSNMFKDVKFRKARSWYDNF
jgi:lipopolysaccharide assembly outer membrane protein LptD (OstA)